MPKFYLATQTKQIIVQLANGKIGIMPTDTVYGLVGDAHNSNTVDEIYTVKERDRNKPLIILIADYPQDVVSFGITLPSEVDQKVQSNWPGPVSILFPCKGDKFNYLHRGTEELALRLPKNDWLRNILQETGPLIATSANKQGQPTATTIEEAYSQLSDQVDFYIDGGTITAIPSRLIRITLEGRIQTIRP